MEVINQIVGFIGKLFEWWVVVMPWEQAIFIRAGKNERLLSKGWYFKIPFVDRVYIQQIRLRIIDLPIQTVSTSDGKAITIKSVIGYSIKDMFQMYNTISHPEMTLSGIVMGAISEYIKTTSSKEISHVDLEKTLLSKISENNYGLGDLSIKITNWAEVKTFRLIQDQSFMYSEQLKMNHLGEKN